MSNNSIALGFGDDGAVVIDFSKKTSGGSAALQAAIVNIHTILGSDPTQPDRGTDLTNAANNGNLYDEATTQHELNFAALETLDILPESYSVLDVACKLIDFSNNRAIFSVTVGLEDGSEVKQITYTQ